MDTQYPNISQAEKSATYIRLGFSETMIVIATGPVESITRMYWIFQDMEKHILVGFKSGC